MPAPGCQILLDDGRPGHPPLRRFANPKAIIETHRPADVPGALADLDRAIRAGKYAAGYFSYELGYALEQRLLPHLWSKRGVPLLWFGIFDTCEDCDSDRATHALATEIQAYAGPLHHGWDEGAYRKRFDRARALIGAGDLYQVNLTFRSDFPFLGDPLTLYRKLRETAEARHCAYVDDGVRQILSLSPELFFDLSAARVLTTRPMKGTAPRGPDAASDAAARAGLAFSTKDRAENLMIVDLLRNDLGRIAEIGSVATQDLFAVETYPTLHQMVSTVMATLKTGKSVEAIVRALFPCGSVTGAPKIRAMEVISALEASPRGVYCGSIGYFAPDGSARFNVAIRTITLQGGRGELGIGGAITHDSDPTSEYRECLLKALYYEATRRPLELIETLRYTPQDGFVRGGRHLARMADSASAFGIVFDEAAANQTLNGSVAETTVASRVRLTLSENGTFACTVVPADPTPPLWTYVVSPQRLNSGDPLLRHKTNWRDFYDTEQRHVAREFGADEVIFLNEREELTEGSRTNLFIERDGKLLTPALACGLLDGRLRHGLIAEGRCVETTLTARDLDNAATVYLGNSFRGLIKAELA
jgi:para-aminobenzoate synthetase / 4-amino-4-deoxychorismate lyase